MENIVEDLLEEFSYYYKIHSQTITQEDLTQKEKGINRMKSMAATYFNEDKDYMSHLEEEQEQYKKIKYSIAAAFISDTAHKIELYRRGFGPSTLKEYCQEFKDFAKDIIFLQSRGNKL